VSTALALTGWLVAAVTLLRLRHLVRVVADAEHELRGAITVIGLAVERTPRTRYADLLGLQLGRMRAAVADLQTARVGRRGGRGGGPELRSVRLAQLLANLVANAAEHGVGPAEVATTRLPSGVRVEIRNRNRPPDGRGQGATRGTGRGRGLAIAARAAREIGGSLSVASVNGQTIATVELPAPDAADERRAA
jgi:hypothetical protein